MKRPRRSNLRQADLKCECLAIPWLAGGQTLANLNLSLARMLGTRQQQISEWVEDLMARRRSERLAVIWKLHELGWSQERIAEVMELEGHGGVQRYLPLIPESVKVADTLLRSGKSVVEVANNVRITALTVGGSSLGSRAGMSERDEMSRKRRSAALLMRVFRRTHRPTCRADKTMERVP